jgi:hypothetical protein
MNNLETAFNNVIGAIKKGNKAGLYELEESAALLKNVQEIGSALFPPVHVPKAQEEQPVSKKTKM